MELQERLAGEIRLPDPVEWNTDESPAPATVEARLLHRDGSDIPRTVEVRPFRAGTRRCCFYLLGRD